MCGVHPSGSVDDINFPTHRGDKCPWSAPGNNQPSFARSRTAAASPAPIGTVRSFAPFPRTRSTAPHESVPRSDAWIRAISPRRNPASAANRSINVTRSSATINADVNASSGNGLGRTSPGRTIGTASANSGRPTCRHQDRNDDRTARRVSRCQSLDPSHSTSAARVTSPGDDPNARANCATCALRNATVSRDNPAARNPSVHSPIRPAHATGTAFTLGSVTAGAYPPAPTAPPSPWQSPHRSGTAHATGPGRAACDEHDGAAASAAPSLLP